jgi:hypothetical protein
VAQTPQTPQTPQPTPRGRGRKRDQAAAAREREARSVSGVSGLLARRPELRGVLETADWLAEATLWSA